MSGTKYIGTFTLVKRLQYHADVIYPHELAPGNENRQTELAKLYFIEYLLVVNFSLSQL